MSRRVTRGEADMAGGFSSIQSIWCGMRICEQHLADGTVVARYYKEGELHAGTAYYYAQDQVGSVVAMVDASGQVAGRTTYGPYGQIIAQSGVQPNYAYAGLYRHQASGLYIATYRAYDPATARWINRDPVGEVGGLNLYQYVSGSPNQYVDVLGLEQTIYGKNSLMVQLQFVASGLMGAVTITNTGINLSAGAGVGLGSGVSLVGGFQSSNGNTDGISAFFAGSLGRGAGVAWTGTLKGFSKGDAASNQIGVGVGLGFGLAAGLAYSHTIPWDNFFVEVENSEQSILLGCGW